MEKKTKMPGSAKDKKLCRLCGEMKPYSHQIFAANSSAKDELVRTILSYLGIQLVDDGIMPNWLCDFCYYGAASTKFYMKRVLSGQEKLEQRVEQTETAKKYIKEPPKNLVDSQEPSTDAINTGRIKQQAKKKCQVSLIKNTPKKNISKEPTTNTNVPVDNSTENDLLPSYISDNSDAAANKSNLKEAFAELRVDDGTTLAALIFIDTDIETNRHLTISKINFICTLCKKRFSSRDFQHHLVDEHNYFAYKCPDCLQRCQNKSSFNKHQKESCHHGESFNITEDIINPKDVSDECTNLSMQHSSAGKTEVDSGMTENSQDQGTMTKPTTSNVDVRNSQSKSNGFAYHCTKCEKKFDAQSSALRHFNCAHTGRLFKCPECTATYKHKTTYTYHMAKHTGERRFKCNICTKAFRVRTELVIHERTHTGERPFQCKYCKKDFGHRSNMVAHTRLHTGQKPFKCDNCDCEFTRSSHLKKHKEVVHLRKEQAKKANKRKNAPVTATTTSEKKSSELEKSSLRKFNSADYQFEMLPPFENSIVQATAQNVTQNGISQLLETSAEDVVMIDSNNLQSLIDSDCSFSSMQYLTHLEPELNEMLNIGIKDVEQLEKSDAENDDSSFLNLDSLDDAVIDSIEPSINLASNVVCISHPDPEKPNGCNVSIFFVPK